MKLDALHTHLVFALRQVNHMAGNTLRQDGLCVKLVTRIGEHLPGVYIEDRNGRVLHSIELPADCESHFDNRCVECTF